MQPTPKKTTHNWVERHNYFYRRAAANSVSLMNQDPAFLENSGLPLDWRQRIINLKREWVAWEKTIKQKLIAANVCIKEHNDDGIDWKGLTRRTYVNFAFWCNLDTSPVYNPFFVLRDKEGPLYVLEYEILHCVSAIRFSLNSEMLEMKVLSQILARKQAMQLEQAVGYKQLVQQDREADLRVLKASTLMKRKTKRRQMKKMRMNRQYYHR